MALALAMVMVLAMGVTVFAASDYSITVNNTNSNITIAGKKYTAYKLFDATYSGDAVAYSIDKDSYFYKTSAIKIILEDYVTFTAASGDSQNIVVTPKDTFDETKARELADKLQPYLFHLQSL